MALLTFASFRTATLDEACTGLALTTTEASDTALTSAIARLTRRLNDLTGDQFESLNETLELDVYVNSNSLLLPKRTTALATVKTRYWDGTLTTQTSTAYRLRSSLDAAGALRIGAYDSLELLYYSGGLTTVITLSPYEWPQGAHTVQVTGTFGWTTPPLEVKEALAELVWDHFKRIRGDLGRAQSINAGGANVLFVPSVGEKFYNGKPKTGIPRVDAFVEEYSYDVFSGVG